MMNVEFLASADNDTQKAIVVFVGVMVFFILVGTFVLAHRLSSKSAKKNNLLSPRKEMESWISNYDYNSERSKTFSDENLLHYFNAQLTEIGKHREHNAKLLDEQEKILKAKIALIEKKINQPKQPPVVSQVAKPSLFNQKNEEKKEPEPTPKEVVRTESFQHITNQPPLAYANNLNQPSYGTKVETSNDDIYTKYAEDSLFSNTAKKVLSLDSTNEIIDEENNIIPSQNFDKNETINHPNEEPKTDLDTLLDEFETEDENELSENNDASKYDHEDQISLEEDNDIELEDNEEQMEFLEEDMESEDNEEQMEFSEDDENVESEGDKENITSLEEDNDIELEDDEEETEEPFRPSSVIDFKMDQLEAKISNDISIDDFDSQDDFDWLDENNDSNDQEETLDEEDLI